LLNPANPNAVNDTDDAQSAARVLGLALQVVKASNAAEIDLAFAVLVQKQIGALFLVADPLFAIRRSQIAALALRHAIPATYPNPAFVTAGGLLSYATNRNETYRQMGIYTGRILKGTKPSDLPIMLPTKFELTINLITAKALGLEIPPKLLALSDAV